MSILKHNETKNTVKNIKIQIKNLKNNETVQVSNLQRIESK